jgi:hypothetical protein
MRARVAVAVVAAALCGGCSSSGSTAGTASQSGSSGIASARPRTGSQDLILESEIAARAGEATNALQIIMKLRPQMLRSRGVISPNDANSEATMPKIYVDNVSYGNVESLSNINATQIKEIQYIKATDATTRWGTGHTGGVILVITKK